MDIKKDKDFLMVKIPLTQKEANCYMEDKDLQDVPNLLGVIIHEKGQADYTINRAINMSYCGKPDQTGMPLLHLEKEEWEKVIKMCGLSTIEYPECSKCGKTIMGSHTWSEKGELCFECADE